MDVIFRRSDHMDRSSDYYSFYGSWVAIVIQNKKKIAYHLFSLKKKTYFDSPKTSYNRAIKEDLFLICCVIQNQQIEQILENYDLIIVDLIRKRIVELTVFAHLVHSWKWKIGR